MWQSGADANLTSDSWRNEILLKKDTVEVEIMIEHVIGLSLEMFIL